MYLLAAMADDTTQSTTEARRATKPARASSLQIAKKSSTPTTPAASNTAHRVTNTRRMLKWFINKRNTVALTKQVADG